MQNFENKYDLLNAAYQDERLSKSAVALFQYLVYKSDKMKSFPAVDTIAKAMNVCRRTVQYSMRKLEQAGYIMRKERWYNHQQLTNIYEFNFGITEEEQLKKFRYTDEEKEELHKFLIHYPDSDFRDSNLVKSKEVLKVYNMNLSKYEKLLLIYLIHRADKKAFIYDEIETYMKALGVCRTTMIGLMAQLREKGLILIKSKRIGDKFLITIKLTGKVVSNTSQNKQTQAADQNDIMMSGRNDINVAISTCAKGYRRKVRKIAYLLASFIKKTYIFLENKIREILII